tara:strand:- start:318 stop:557 length:240 start_codon:yes stop_codon:yes gene_type:complete
LKNFWPRRDDPKGFSIKNFANKYREKLSNITNAQSTNQFSGNVNLDAKKESKRQFKISQYSKKRGHWANRDFSEYREAA